MRGRVHARRTLKGLVADLRVIANNGVIVAKTDNYNENGLNVSSLMEGSYIVVLKTSSGSIVKRILKVY